MSEPGLPPVDVQELMREVQRRARTQQPDSESRSAEGVLHRLDEHIDLLSVPLASPRSGVGKVITATKRALARLLQPVLHRQTQFNMVAARLISETLEHVEVETARLARHLTRIEQQITDVAEQLGQCEELVQRRVERLSARLIHLEGSVHQPAQRSESLPEVSIAVQRDEEPPPAPRGHDRIDTAVAGLDQFAMQDRFRGSEEEIKARQRTYLDHFEVSGLVVDVGCGRGEFLELLREAGIPARGVDLDLDNVLHCRAKGLDVIHGDAFEFLEALPDGSLAGVFSAQFIEHFLPPRVVYFANLSARKLRPSGVALYETPNPECLTVFAHAFYLDFTHVWPYHPQVMNFVMQAAGFTDVKLLFSSPIDPAARLPQLVDDGVFGNQTGAYNRAAEFINRLVLGPQDYAVVGRRRANIP